MRFLFLYIGRFSGALGLLKLQAAARGDYLEFAGTPVDIGTSETGGRFVFFAALYSGGARPSAIVIIKLVAYESV